MTRKKPVARLIKETDSKDALKRLADLTRKIVRVPKSELPTDSRKEPRPQHPD
jgi:hypothetical protein